MHERFTDRAHIVMRLADQEAKRFNHEYIGTEHILLGLIKEGSGVAAKVLKNLDVDLKKVRREVEKIVQPGPDPVTTGKLPQTPRAKRVIEFAIEEARDLNHNYIGTEHLLLGLLRENEGVGSQVLLNLGLNLEAVRREVLSLLGYDITEEDRAAIMEPPAVTVKEFRELEAQIDDLRREMEEAVGDQDFEKAASLRDQADKLKKRRENLTRALRRVKARELTEFELYIPTHHNDGSVLDPAKLARVRQRLSERFGGVLESRHPIEGSLRIGDSTFRNEVIVLRVFSEAHDRDRDYMALLKQELKRDLQQSVALLVRKAEVL